VSARQQRGVAIVLAMGVVMLAAVAAVAIMVTQSTWARHNELTIDHAQARRVVDAGVHYARAVLSDDRRSSSIDHLGEPWALRLGAMQIDNGEVEGYIEDQQGAFNVNNLVRGGKVVVEQLAYLRRLLSILGLPPALADAVADWIDADSAVQTPGGAEDAYYLSLDPPYLAANRALIDVAELALVRGFDERVLARLRPFVTALPQYTPVNVNTAPPEVLAAIVEGLGLDGARALAAQRERIYFRTTAEFSSRLSGGARVRPEDVAVGSEYFLVVVHATSGEAVASGTALLAREDARFPVIIWRKYP
jgi:general secretion pathway protein K